MSSPVISSNWRWSELSSGMVSHEKRSAIKVLTNKTSGVLIHVLWSYLAAHVKDQSFSRDFECASIQL